MVRIINYVQRTSEDGKSFFVLEVQGGIEMVKSQQTGSFYATGRKATLPSTFDETTCKALIGTEMPGRISKIVSEAYEYTIRETGEIITLNHRFVYEPEEAQVPRVQETDKSNTTVDEFMKQRVESSFSNNGFLVKP